MITKSEINSLDETQAFKLHLELSDEATKWCELASIAYAHMARLRRERELKEHPELFVSQPTSRHIQKPTQVVDSKTELMRKAILQALKDPNKKAMLDGLL